MRTRLEATVRGLVQGVFFRHFTQKKAQELGLLGTVANRPDGTVVVIAEGPKEDVDKLLEWLKRGSELAHVDHVDIKWCQPLDDQSEFTIVR
jgi:acylphosphatase